MALAAGIAFFSASATGSFTWTPITGPLTSPTPLVFGPAIIITSGTGMWVANLVGQPNASGGSIQMSDVFTGFVIYLGMDPL